MTYQRSNTNNGNAQWDLLNSGGKNSMSDVVLKISRLFNITLRSRAYRLLLWSLCWSWIDHRSRYDWFWDSFNRLARFGYQLALLTLWRGESSRVTNMYVHICGSNMSTVSAIKCTICILDLIRATLNFINDLSRLPLVLACQTWWSFKFTDDNGLVDLDGNAFHLRKFSFIFPSVIFNCDGNMKALSAIVFSRCHHVNKLG